MALLLAATSLHAASAWAAECSTGPAALAYTLASEEAPLLVVPGAVDAIDPVAVVVDTGASAPFDIFLSNGIAERLGLNLSEEITPPDSTAIGPQRQTYRTTKLSRFAVGPIQGENVTAAVVPMIDAMGQHVGRPIDAIVGHQLLKDRTITIDFGARRLDLAARAGPREQAIGFDTAPKKPLVLVRVLVNGRGPFSLQIDTGATGTTLSPQTARSAAVQLAGEGKLRGAGGEVNVQVGQAELKLGPTSRRTRVAVSEAVSQVAEAAGGKVDGVLGTDFFSGGCLTIDFPGRRLWLDSPRG